MLIKALSETREQLSVISRWKANQRGKLGYAGRPINQLASRRSVVASRLPGQIHNPATADPGELTSCSLSLTQHSGQRHSTAASPPSREEALASWHPSPPIQPPYTHTHTKKIEFSVECTLMLRFCGHVVNTKLVMIKNVFFDIKLSHLCSGNWLALVSVFSDDLSSFIEKRYIWKSCKQESGNPS